jgi:hypothetical protein
MTITPFVPRDPSIELAEGPFRTWMLSMSFGLISAVRLTR